jgi:hypothetical protein
LSFDIERDVVVDGVVNGATKELWLILIVEWTDGVERHRGFVVNAAADVRSANEATVKNILRIIVWRLWLLTELTVTVVG